MAKVDLILQGKDKNENHKNLVKLILSKGNIKKVLISVAFARSEGVSLIKKELENAINNGAEINVFVGVRNGVTSKQALKKLFNCNVNLYIVDTGKNGLLFHPKIYMVDCEDKSFAVVGSANLTNGGLLSNIEASSFLELNRNDSNDYKFIQNTLEVFDNLAKEHPQNIYRIRRKDEIEELYEEGKLIDEKTEIKTSFYGSNLTENKSVTPIIKLKTEKPKKKKKKVEEILNEKNKSKNNKEVVTLDKSDLIGVTLTEIWRSKKLTERDLNIPSGSNSNVTGSMTLKKGEYSEIDQRHYFRENVFNNLKWKNSNDKKPYLEYAYAKFYIIIEGVNYGEYKLKLKHDPRTDIKSYEQKNAMTHLLWKNAKHIIRNRNLLDKKMRIYKVENIQNKFVIKIQ